MADRETQYVTLVNDNPPSPSSSSLLSPRRKVERGWLKVRQSAHRFWMLEVLASALSLLIFMTILVALYYLDNSIYSNASGTQGNETRRPHIFPILAFSSAVMRATMLLPVATAIGQLKWSWFRSPRRLIDIERFDEAARGILGSAKLFFYLRFRNLAAMGAALTILALPIDALIQSAIRMPTKVELVNNLRNLSPEFMEAQNETFLERAVSYTKWQTMTDATDVWPETAMVNAIQYGLGFINGPSDYVKTQTIVDCPTGYCDFTKAQTLSVGYECMYRDDIVYVPRKGNMAPYQTLPGTDLRLYVEGYRGVTRQRIVAATYSQYPVPEPILDYPMEYFDNDPLLKIKVPLIARTSMMFNWINATDQEALRSTYAMDCALFWKVRTMEMYVNDASNFTLNSTDTQVGTKSNRDEYGRWVLRPSPCFVDGIQVPARNETGFDEIFYRNNCVFWVRNETHNGIQTMLKDKEYGFMGNLTHINATTGRWNRRNTFTMNMERACWGKTPQQTMSNIKWMWSNIAFFAGFTVRGSESIQVDGTSAHLNVTGTVSALVTYYSVDWLRLSMPAFIVLCCALFVLYTAFLTRNEYAWRRSALPLLFHGLEDHERFAQGDVRDFKVMQDAAKEIRVRLTEHVDENGARLTTQK